MSYIALAIIRNWGDAVKNFFLNGGNMKKEPKVLIGTGGWDHESFDRVFYPDGDMDSLQKLHHYAQFFDVVEVRPTFWDEALTCNDAWEWIGAVADNRRFQFNVKLHQSFTHRKEIKPALTKNVRSVLQELLKADRLGTLLIQFPYAFTCTSAHRYHLMRLSEVFAGFPMHVEFRHESWNYPGLAGFLAEHKLGTVNADLPRIKQLMPFSTGFTGDTAYIRLHGRNEHGWMKNELDARYDYLYNNREVRELTRRLEILTPKCKHVTVICNNTTQGRAIANAVQLVSALSSENSVVVPGKTLAAFPQLAGVAVPVDEQPILIEADSYRRVV